MKKQNYISLVSLALILLLPAFMMAQGSVKGIITDGVNGEPLIGATVVVQGTTKGSVTDFDGNYEITGITAGSYKLLVSYTGYASQTIEVTIANGQTATADFALSSSATDLDLVVVTGTGGPVEKKKIGNSIGTIDTKKLEELPINSFSDILQGREPGMVALPSSGLTGEGAQIRIRGNASLSQLNEPIVLVDGVRIDNGGGLGGGFVGAGGGGSTSRLDDINPEAIERIEILKGASAATLFGTEASNGVIQIFTKKGKKGTPQIDLKAVTGFITFPKGRVPDNTGFTSDPARAQELSSFFGRTIQPYELISFNAMEDLYETGITTQFSGSISGGTELFNYFVSGRLTDTDGPIGPKNDADRGYPAGIQTEATDTDQMGQLNVNVNIFPNDKVNIRLTSGYTDRRSTTLQNNNNIYGVGSLAQFSKPELARPDNTTGTIAFATVNETLQISFDSKVKNYNGSVGINYYPTKWLKLDGVFGVNYSNTNSTELWPFGWNIDQFSGANPAGFAAYAVRDFLALSTELKASMNHQISDVLSSNFILGGQLIRSQVRNTSGSGQDFPGPGFEVASAASILNVFEFFQETVNAGIFGQEQIGFNDNLFITFGGRLDAHSAFGADFQAQFYPKVSLSYVLSDTEWWSPIGPINSLQLRGSWGWAGLQPGAFDALTTYQALASASGAGIAPNNLGNSELSPEISKEWEAGVTMGLFNNRASFEFTYWDRVVDDALFARQFPVTGGFRGSQLVNIGQLAGNGVEVGVNATVIRNQDVTLDLYVNGAYLNEEILDLGGAPPIKVGGSYPRYRNFLIEGFAPGANFGAKLVNYDPATQLPIDIVDGDGQPDSRQALIQYLSGLAAENGVSLPTTPGVGGVLLVDEDGDGDNLDHYLGKSAPDWSGAFGGSLKWKRFSINTTFEYRAGNYVINNLTDAFRQANGAIGRNLPTSARVNRDYITGGVDASGNPQNSGEVRLAALEEWLTENLALAPFSGLNTFEKGDFIRWRELSINYSFPREFLSKLGFRSASFGVSGRNLALFTGYSGVDPELQYVGRGGGNTLDQNFGQGVAAFGWPIPRQVIFTLKVGL